VVVAVKVRGASETERVARIGAGSVAMDTRATLSRVSGLLSPRLTPRAPPPHVTSSHSLSLSLPPVASSSSPAPPAQSLAQ
jgi:hypothetical protein